MNNQENILPSDFTGTTLTFDVDYSGNAMIYTPSNAGGLRLWYLNSNTEINKYLLSFDSKNTWYSYKSGSWAMVQAGSKPSESIFDEYGMTVEEINALSEADFARLYENGNEVYTIDFAIYFTSISPYITPSINSITIFTDEGNSNLDCTSMCTPLYAAKSVDFDGSEWRKVNRLYPVEINPKEATFLYFIYANDKYQYYDGSAWQVETTTEISSLIADAESNWIDLMQIGMSAEEVRAIPADALTSQLAYEDFSVVYCMKVIDTSTEEYYSIISADYTEDLFASSNLTLSITMNDGTVMQISGLTDTQIEDFMEWLNGRQYNEGPIFYTIKSGSTSYFINYYMIQSVTVVES